MLCNIDGQGVGSMTEVLQDRRYRRLIYALAAFILAVAFVAFLNFQMDDEVHIGFYDCEGYPEKADFENGVVTVDESMGLSEGDLIARIPALHVDSGEFILDCDHQNENDFEAVILDNDRELFRFILPASETNTKYRFGSKKNLYNLRIDFLYNGKGKVTVKKSTLYSVDGPFYYDTVFFALLVILAAAAIVGLLIRYRFFDLPFYQRLFWAVLILFLVYINYPFYRPVETGAGGDIGYHITRVEGIYQGLAEGQTPPLLYPDAMRGRGMIGVLYPYLFCMIPAFFRLCRVSIEGALRVWFILINLASCISAYYAGKRLTGSSRMALLTMILYGVLPYRITTLTWRYAYGETLTFIFIPLVFAGMYEIIAGEEKRWPILSFGIAGIISSHLVTSLQMGVLCSVTALIFLPVLIKNKRVRYMLYSAVGGGALTLWYTIPFLYYYNSNIELESHTAGDLPYITYYISQMMQLLPNNQESRQIYHQVETVGVWLILLVLLALVVQMSVRERDTEDKMGVEFIVLGALFVFGTTKAFPWQTLEKFRTLYSLGTLLQFPTRLYLMGQSLLLFGAIISIRKWRPGRYRARQWFIVGTVGIALLQGDIIADSYLTRLTPFVDVRQNRFTANISDMIEYDFYAPYGYDNDDDFNAASSPLAEIKGYVHEGTHTEFEYVSDKDTYAVLPIAYYYGYEAEDTDRLLKLTISGTDKGYIRVELPASEKASHVEVTFKGYSYSIPLILFSAIAFAGMIIILFRPYVIKRGDQKEESAA